MTEMDGVYVIPLKIITTQALLLLLAIAIEAFVMRQQLQFSPRKSIEFATTLNLLSTVIGWLVFFVGSGPFLLPTALKLQVLNFALFGLWGQDLATWFIVLSFITFFGTIGVESVGFLLLQRILNEELSEEISVDNKRVSVRQASRRSPAGSQQVFSIFAGQLDTVLSVMLMGNVFSYVAIVVVLVALQLTSVVGI